VGRYGGTDFDFSAERVIGSVEESLSRLGVNYIDLLLCHDVEFVPIAQIWEETLPALAKVVEAGKVGFLGFSGLPLPIFYRVLEQTELVSFILSYCHYNLLDTSLDTLLPYLAAKNIGVINASPLSMGLLSDRGFPEWHPAPDTMKNACIQAREHCAEWGIGLGDLGLAFSLAHPGIASTLVGMSSVAQVEQNLAAAETIPNPLLLMEVRRILQPFRDQSWASGLPENNL